MFAIETSPSRSESSSTSNTDDTSSSTQSVNTVFYDFVDFQPPKGFGTDLSRVKNDESPSPHQESSEEEYSGPWPKPKPGYTRRLIRMIRIPLLFRLRPEIERAVAEGLPPACPGECASCCRPRSPPSTRSRAGRGRFIIWSTRRISPPWTGLAAALARIGNIASDGRPILGLDARDLLEIALGSGPDCLSGAGPYLDAVVRRAGSQSGFDSIAECYGDLARHIFAVETGLSSDPAMNWRLSRSIPTGWSPVRTPIRRRKLGREATPLHHAPTTSPSAARWKPARAMCGTVEFFPEEGKYHLDGHRKCGVKLSPRETLAQGGRCPVCGGPDDRRRPAPRRGARRPRQPTRRRRRRRARYRALSPCRKCSASSRAAGRRARPSSAVTAGCSQRSAPNSAFCRRVPLEDISRADSSLLAEAMARLRAGKVIRDAGYDGEYGVIRLFETDELRRRTAGGCCLRRRRRLPCPLCGRLAQQSTTRRSLRGRPTPTPNPSATGAGRRWPAGGGEPQRASAPSAARRRSARGGVRGRWPAADCRRAGLGQDPHADRIASRISSLSAASPAAHCLAITFTRRAAAEMRERLHAMLGADADGIAVHTFHSLGLAILREHAARRRPAARLPRRRRSRARRRAGRGARVCRDRARKI